MDEWIDLPDVGKRLTPEAYALLDTIAGTESPGYNTIYGGKRVKDLSWHPRIDVPIQSGPNAGKTSSAAGRYQFLKDTWDDQASKLGLKDFSPESQDLAAWDLAQSKYGADLMQALQSGNPKQIARVGQKLNGVWTSLPGGIEAGTNEYKFAKAYERNLSKRKGPGFAERVLDFIIPAAHGSELPQDEWVDVPDSSSQLVAAQDEWVDVPEESWFQRNKPTIDQGLRMTAKMAAAPIAGPVDLINDAIAAPINALRPGTIPTQPLHKYLDLALRKAGIDPQSAGRSEDVLQALTNAGFTASAIQKLAPLLQDSALFNAAEKSGANPMTQAAASGGSVLGSNVAGDMARDSGATPNQELWAKIGGGILGGGVTAIGANMAENVGEGIKRSLKPFTTGGQEALAGRILRKQATAPNTSMGRVEGFNDSLLPDSQPTLAEVTQDPGLARLQRILPSSQVGLEAGVDQINAIRASQMDNAIHDALNRVNKMPAAGMTDKLTQIGQIKNRISEDFAQGMEARGINLITQPVDLARTAQGMQAIGVQKVGKPVIENLLADLKQQIEAVPPAGVDPTAFQKIWNIRQNLDTLVYQKMADVNKPAQRELKAVGEQMRTLLNEDLKAALPEGARQEFERFLNRYRRVATVEGQIEAGRTLKERIENTGRTIAGEGERYGQRTLSGAKLENLDRSATGESLMKRLNPAQREAFRRAQEEKARANILATGGAPGNSATAQNQALDNIIARDIMAGFLGDKAGGFLSGIVEKAGVGVPGRIVSAAAKPFQNDIMRMVAKGLIDPEEGARLMKLGQFREPDSFRSALQSLNRPGTLAEMYSNLIR